MRSKRAILVGLLSIDANIHEILAHSSYPEKEILQLLEESKTLIEEVNEAFDFDIELDEIHDKDLLKYLKL